MRKVLGLILAGALFGSVEASAQEIYVKTVSPNSGYIGIRFDGMRVFSDEERSERVIIREVSKDSPAEKAGLRAGDEVIRINGLSPANGKFAALARTLTVGDTVKLRIKRDNKERDYSLVAAARPAGHASMIGDRTWVFNGDSVTKLMRMYLDSARVHLDSLKLPRVWVQHGDSSFDIRINRAMGMLNRDSVFFRVDSMFQHLGEVRFPRGEFHFEEFGPGPIIRSIEVGSRAIAGAEFTDLDPAMKTYFGTDRGLLTLRVVAETPAARAGLQAGDVIVKANDRTITKVSDLRQILFANPETLKLEILRNRETRTLEVPLQRKRSNE
jgi:membrane-associated protease RseP (regulator of RpoE activity)